MSGSVMAFRWCCVAVLLLAATPASSAPGQDPLARRAIPAQDKLNIDVAPGNWGSADVRDIQTFLEAVGREFAAVVAPPEGGVVRLRVIPRGGSPRVRYDRGAEGEYLVQLTARNQSWFQYAYQFSHELCHIYSHFDHKDRPGDGDAAGGNQWFEESLCETASLFTLRRLAAAWREAPPVEWKGYESVLAAYATFLLEQPHRHLAASQTMLQWYRDNQAALQRDPYQRDKNELVATALLPLFERDPHAWQAINYLNRDPGTAAKGFADFLGDWYAACPEGDRTVVRDTMALFGVVPAALRVSAVGDARSLRE